MRDQNEFPRAVGVRRQAYQFRLIEVEDTLTDAFAARFKSTSKGKVNPRLLAGVTLAIMSAIISSWFNGEYKDLSTSARQVFARPLANGLWRDMRGPPGKLSGSLIK